MEFNFIPDCHKMLCFKTVTICVVKCERFPVIVYIPFELLLKIALFSSVFLAFFLISYFFIKLSILVQLMSPFYSNFPVHRDVD